MHICTETSIGRLIHFKDRHWLLSKTKSKTKQKTLWFIFIAALSHTLYCLAREQLV